MTRSGWCRCWTASACPSSTTGGLGPSSSAWCACCQRNIVHCTFESTLVSMSPTCRACEYCQKKRERAIPLVSSRRWLYERDAQCAGDSSGGSVGQEPRGAALLRAGAHVQPAGHLQPAQQRELAQWHSPLLCRTPGACIIGFLNDRIYSPDCMSLQWNIFGSSLACKVQGNSLKFLSFEYCGGV